jgi:hypothetical protein
MTCFALFAPLCTAKECKAQGIEKTWNKSVAVCYVLLCTPMLSAKAKIPQQIQGFAPLHSLHP